VIQLPLLPLVDVVTVNASGPGVPVTVIVWEAGAALFCTCANASDAGVAAMVPGLTSRVTASVAGLPDVNPEVDPIVTAPWYVPGARFEPFAVMVSVAGVAEVAVPLAGDTVNQPEPSVMLTLVLNAISAPLVETVTFPVGAAPPRVCVKESEVGVTDIVAEVTVRVTGTTRGLSRTPAEVAVTVTALV